MVGIKEFLSMEYVVDNDTVGAALHCIKSVLKKYGTSGEWLSIRSGQSNETEW